jgi:hypothetical protein
MAQLDIQVKIFQQLQPRLFPKAFGKRNILVKLKFSLIDFSRGDTFGNLFVPTSTRIFKISTAGLVSTYAGNPHGTMNNGTSATAAFIGSALKLVGDSKGNIYYYEQGYCRIRKISAGSKIVTDFIGDGTACDFNGENTPGVSTWLNGVSGMWFDSIGNFFFGDIYNRRVRKWTFSTGLVQTIAGNGSFGYTNNLPATSSMIKTTVGIAGDSLGNIYFADSGNARIRKITTSGILLTIIGSGICCVDANSDGVPGITMSIGAPGGVKVDVQGNVYFSNSGRIRIYYPNTGLVSTVVGYGCAGFSNDGGSPLSACIFSMEDFWLDTNSNFYLPQPSNNRIRKATPSLITTIAGTGYFSFTGDGGPAVNAQLNYPSATYVDTNGNAYIVDQGNCRVRLVNPAGIISTFGGTSSCGSTVDGYAFTQTSITSLSGITGDTAGNLYLSHSNLIRRISAGSNIVSTISGAGGSISDAEISAVSYNFYNPYGMFIDTNNNLFIAEYSRHKIKKLSLSFFSIVTVAGSGMTTFVDNCEATLASLSYPQAIWVDTIGRYFIADSENRRVRKVENGIMTTYAGTGAGGFNGNGHLATLTSFASVYSIVGDSNGNIYVSDYSNYRIRKISQVNSTSTIVTTVIGNGNSNGFYRGRFTATLTPLSYPVHVTLDSNGNFYVCETSNYMMVRKTVLLSAPTGQPSRQPTDQPTRQPTSQPSSQPTNQPNGRPTTQPSGHPTNQPTMQPSRQPTVQPSTQPTNQPTTQPSNQPTVQPSRQPTGQPSLQPSNQPTIQPTSQPSRQPSSKPTLQPTSDPSSQPTSQPLLCPSSQPTSEPTQQPTRRPTTQPSSQPSSQPSRQPSRQPTKQPTGQPTGKPSTKPTSQPSSQPSRQPSSQPTKQPTVQPTGKPSTQPSAHPTRVPTTHPTSQPSGVPTVHPTSQPSSFPSVQPSGAPTSVPTSCPSAQPTSVPTSFPSSSPSSQPTAFPSCQPTVDPTSQPSSLPTVLPSSSPSSVPTAIPSCQPTALPSSTPTMQPPRLNHLVSLLAFRHLNRVPFHRVSLLHSLPVNHL